MFHSSHLLCQASEMLEQIGHSVRLLMDATESFAFRSARWLRSQAAAWNASSSRWPSQAYWRREVVLQILFHRPHEIAEKKNMQKHAEFCVLKSEFAWGSGF